MVKRRRGRMSSGRAELLILISATHTKSSRGVRPVNRGRFT